MKKLMLSGVTAVILNLCLSTIVFAADDLRSLPAGTVVKSSVDYAILANSRCLVLTDKNYDYGFSPSECIDLFHQEKDATCLLEYTPNVNERKLSGFTISRPYSTGYLLEGVYRNGTSDDGVAAFYAMSQSGKSNFMLACRSAGGRKNMTFDDLKKVLSPYFSLEMPAPVEF